MELFDFPKYKITKPIRVIELFAGIGSQITALKNLQKKGIITQSIESWRVVEFDKYAMQSYNTIHNTQYTIQDIRNIHAEDLAIENTKEYEYILTYSFPCTDLSVAGKGLARKDGLKKGGTTRSGLLWEVERILNECKELPQILLMENVPQVAKVDGFFDWIDFLKSKGYVNHYQMLNAKDYGIPQNRERCFMISFLSPEYVEYEFPQKQKLDKCVMDILENEVEEKYYINNAKAQSLIVDLINRKVLPTHSNKQQATSNKQQANFTTCN